KRTKLEVTWLWCRGASAMLGRSRVAPGLQEGSPGRRARQAGCRLDDGLVQRAGTPVPTQWMGRRACGNESPGSDAVVASS
ncbi:hypothetical protein EDB86DRAFT_2983579, partial [Lactarius hatsudake]